MKLLFKEVPFVGSSTMWFNSTLARKIRRLVSPTQMAPTAEKEPWLSLSFFTCKTHGGQICWSPTLQRR